MADWLIDLVKMPGPISQNGNFYSNDASSPKIFWFQISFKSVKPFGHKRSLRILQLPIPYCVSLIMVTIHSHIFIDIFQTVRFSAVKFTRGNEKNMGFLLIPKSLKVWEKSEANGPGTFKMEETHQSFWRPNGSCLPLIFTIENISKFTASIYINTKKS